MAASYREHLPKARATFDLFVRRTPPQRPYLVCAGLEQALSYLTHFSFSPEDIRYLRSTGLFTSAFLSYLQTVGFKGDVDAMPEGTVFFPSEPVLRVTANIIEAQLVETLVINTFNLQSVIATKASRVVEAAKGRPVVEFGLRRAQGRDAGLQGARSAYLSGCVGTSNVLAGQRYGIPVYGTMAHSFVQAFESETKAFRAFVATFPKGTTLLIDTYDTLEGARRAVRVARELARQGGRLGGVRLDSGDLAVLSRGVRRILDANRLRDVKIFASGNLTEARISELVRAGAPIDAFGVGTEMSVSSDAPALDFVYKMSEVVRGGERYPTGKLSAHKQTYPGLKQVYRVKRGGLAVRDVLGLDDEAVSGRPLLIPVLRQGRLAGPCPSLAQIRRHAARERARLPSRVRSLGEGTVYPVKLSPGLREAVRVFQRSQRLRS
ncbi:MAG: nicotinate phosphoribosyltransferase, partial [Nitrospiraceae bacterium]